MPDKNDLTVPLVDIKCHLTIFKPFLKVFVNLVVIGNLSSLVLTLLFQQSRKKFNANVDFMQNNLKML